jgi:peptide-methionine (R)-S-oxide reductase
MDESKIVNQLSPEQIRVLRDKGTESPFSGEHLNQSADGSYTCAACNAQLFESGKKFDGHCGWPSFSDVASTEAIRLVEDRSMNMQRVEVLCANCGGHLGHVFRDAPEQPTGLRYCINSVSLNFLPKK